MRLGLGRGFGPVTSGTGGEAPEAPTLAVVDAGSGTVTATVTGAGTIRLYYRLAGAAAWTAGSSRSGSGNISQSGLTAGKTYELIAIATADGLSSAPSNLERLYLVTTVSTGFTSLAAEACRNLLAHSTTFQASVGAATAEAAAARIYIGAYEPDEGADWVWPFVVISNAGSGGISRNLQNGEFKISFEMEISEANRPAAQQAAAQLEFENWVSAILSESMETSQLAGFQVVQEFAIIAGPWRYTDHDKQDIMGCDATYRWGLE